MDIAEIAERWVRQAHSGLQTATFEQADLDEITGLEVPPDAAKQALRLFVEIANAASRLDEKLIPMLVLPLPASRRLLTRAPSLRSLLQRRWTNLQPPGFYLTRPDLWAGWEDVEEYRITLEHSVVASRPVSCYYRAWRDQEFRAKGWEFNRAIYFRTA